MSVFHLSLNPWPHIRQGVLFAVALLMSCAPPPESVDEIFAPFEAEGSPGASVMVIRDGDVLHSAGYGTANLGDGSAMSPSTPVRLASVSKTFTAMAIVILQEQGLVDFDAEVTAWVPELARFPDVTVRHLLNHTSGLPDYYDDESSLEEMAKAPERQRPFQNAEAASIYQSWGEPAFVPGEQFSYSNPGYDLLALIVERASGVTFAEFLDVEIFTPLGMQTAVVRDLPTTLIPGRAIGYELEEGGDGWREWDEHWGNWLVGAGGVHASAEDLYRWDQALYQWAESDERMDEVFMPAVLNDGTVSEYGFGWDVSDRLGRRAIHHNGEWLGFRTSLFRFPEDGLSVVVLSNASVDTEELAVVTAELFLD